MIIKEIVNGLYHTYSNAGVYIHGGFPESNYADAYDPIEREYTETDIPIETPEEPEEPQEDEQYAMAGRILMGVTK